MTQFISRRSALLGLVAGGGIALTACSSSDDKGANRTTKLSGADRLRDETRRMAPTSYVKTYDVDASGASGAFKTFADAYKAVQADRGARIGAATAPQSNIWDWRLIRVAPGRYHETIAGVPPHTAIVGQGKRPEDVYIWWDGGENTFESTGRSTYLANLHLDHTGTSADAHPMRDNGPAGDVDLRGCQRRTVIFDNVKFSSLQSGSFGKCTNDMAPRGGVSITFHKCTFDGPGQPQSINLVTNQGGFNVASTIAFIGCHVVSNHSQHPDAKLGQAGDVDAAPVGVPDFSNGRADTFVWMDGTWDVGKTGGVQGLIVMPYIENKGETGASHPKPATRYIVVNSGSVAGLPTLKQEKTLPVRRLVPDGVRLPDNGVSELEKTFFGSKPTAQPRTFWAGSESDTTMKVQAGEVYWVPVGLGDTSACVTAVQVKGHLTGSIAGGAAVDDGGKPIVDGNGRTSGAAGLKGDTTAKLSLRWFFPGQGKVWVGIAFTDQETVECIPAPTGGAFRAQGFKGGNLPDPSGLTHIGAGTQVPNVALVSQLPVGMSA